MKKLVIRFNSPVVLCFALLSLLALLLGDVTGGAATTQFFCVYRSSLADPLTYLRLFTHVLGHAGYSHYMGNMLLLLLVGPPLEEKYGSRTLLLTIVLSSFTEMKKGGIPITLILVVVFYLGGELVDGLKNTDNISQLTHIVGGACGMVFGFTLRSRKR